MLRSPRPTLRRPRFVAAFATTSALLLVGSCDRGSKSSPPDEGAAAAPLASTPTATDPVDPATPADPVTSAEPATPATDPATPATDPATPATDPTDPAGDPSAPPDKNAAQETSNKTKQQNNKTLPSPIFGKGDRSCGRDPGVGERLKPFNLSTPSGKKISSAQLRGRVVLVNFWGTWCKPCLKELPEFDRLYRRYRGHGLVVLAIATDTDPAPVVAFARDRRLATKLAIGGEDLATSYQSPSFPFSFIVDEHGIIQASYRGFKPECMGQLEQDIRGQLSAS